MSDTDAKVEESPEADIAPEAGGDKTPGVSDGEFPDDPLVQESKASPLEDDGNSETHESGSRRESTNGASAAALKQAGNDEFILVEDVDSSKGGTGHDEDDDIGVDYEEEEYGDECVSAQHRDIHDVVNDVLDTKLESFQAQIQKMFTMMQGTMGGPPGKAEEGMDESVEPEDYRDLPVQSGSKEDDSEPPEQPQFKHQKKEWKEFLGRVSTILDLEETSVKSVLDETVGSGEKVAECLPAEGAVKNSWKKVKGKVLPEVTKKCSKQTLQNYPWPANDMELYGKVTYTNRELVDYLQYVAGDAKQMLGLQGRSKRQNADLRAIEGQFRYQQRIVSYATYFTAALGKLLAAEQLAEKDKIEELLKNLGQSLMDASDTSVNGCALTTRAIRRVFVDALEIAETNNHDFNLTRLPLAQQLFPQPELGHILMNFGINLEKPHLSRGGFAGRESFSQRGGRARGMGRGFTPRGRGAHPRGTPFPVRGVMRGRGGPRSKAGKEQEWGSPSRGRGVSPRGRSVSPRGRSAYQRGRGTRGTRSRGWQPRTRVRGRGRGLKRGPHDDSPVAEKHRRVGSIPTVDPGYTSQGSRYEVGENPRNYGGERGESPQCEWRGRGVDYQSVPDDPSSYYRSHSERELSPHSSYSNEGWY